MIIQKVQLAETITDAEDVTDADWARTKTICKDFEIKNLGENHDLYVRKAALKIIK